MWSDGASLVTWFALRDGPQSTEPFGFGVDGGLYFRTTESYADERVKPSAQAFRFPFVAVPESGRVTIWGRTPDSSRQVVTIERRRGGRWARLDRIRTNRHGIFRSRRKRLGRSSPARPGGQNRLAALQGRHDARPAGEAVRRRSGVTMPRGPVPPGYRLESSPDSSAG